MARGCDSAGHEPTSPLPPRCRHGWQAIRRSSAGLRRHSRWLPRSHCSGSASGSRWLATLRRFASQPQATPAHSRRPARSHGKWRALHPAPRNAHRPTRAAWSIASSRSRICRGAVTSIDWRDGRARIVLAEVGYDALIVALEALQRDARLRVVEATLTARVEPGIVRAELTLAPLTAPTMARSADSGSGRNGRARRHRRGGVARSGAARRRASRAVSPTTRCASSMRRARSGAAMARWPPRPRAFRSHGTSTSGHCCGVWPECGSPPATARRLRAGRLR